MDANNSDNASRQRNPNILDALDPMHRSLLNSNLRYEQDDRNSSEDGQSLHENDSDEYYTPISTVVSTDSGTDCGAIPKRSAIPATSSNHRVNGRQSQQHIEPINKTDLLHSTNFVEAGKQSKTKLIKSIEHSKQSTKQTSNVLSTKNRCNTNGATANGLRRSTGTVERIRTIDSNSLKSSRQKQSRNSLDSSRTAQLRHTSSSGGAKRKQRAHAKSYSDSSDINSEANLVIENMRNRECEMFRKISFNNGYFSTTGSSSDYMYYTSDTNTIESKKSPHSAHCKHAGKEKKRCMGCQSNGATNKSPKLMTRRRCRSFPLTNNSMNQQIRDANETETETETNRIIGAPLLHEQNQINNIECTETETNTIRNTRKITITIKTNAMANGVSVSASETKQVQSKQIPIFRPNTSNGCESSDESDSTVSDSGGEHNMNSDSSKSCQMHENDSVNGNASEVSSSDASSFFSLSSDAECVSEASQYFNCMSFTDLSASNSHSIERIDKIGKNNNDIDQDSRKMAPGLVKNNGYCAQTMPVKRRSADPMITIEQELSRNCVLTSKVKVDKQKVKEFKAGLRKSGQCQNIVDSTFSKEIFDKTIHLDRKSDISCNKEVIDSIVSSLETQSNINKCRKSSKSLKNAQNEQQKFIGDGFMFEKLHASPKFTGKSISRLLAHRLEQHSITNVRRSLLQNVGYAITEKERKAKKDKHQLTELPPIKPPRSFVASASSSPLSKQSFETSATIPICELNKIEVAPMGFVPPKQPHDHERKAYTTKYEPSVGEAHSVHFGWTRPQSNFDNDSATIAQYMTAEPTVLSSHYYSVDGMRSQPNCSNIPPKENIDTVDSARNSNNDFAQFTANLKENFTMHYSTPIKIANNQNVHRTEQSAAYTTVPTYESVKICEKCHCVKDKSPKMLSSQTGRKIGKAALKRTKTLIGTSKKFLKRPLTRQPSKKHQHQQTDAANVNDDSFRTPLKGGDNTVCNNCDTTGANGYCDKRIDKSLNLTPKETNKKRVTLQESPTRAVNTSNVQLLKHATATNLKVRETDNVDSEVYVTPEEDSFNFERVISAPPQEKSKSLKRSPTKVISMLAKSSKNFFRSKQRTNEKRNSLDESTHYYKANDYDELDHKVLLMNEVLAEMRKRIEMGQGSCSDINEVPVGERPPSAKKCSFRNRTISTSSGDLLEDGSIIEKITRIDLHDEPEPLYAEIEAQMASNNIGSDTLYRSCLDDSNVDKTNGNIKRGSVELREIYLNSGTNSTQPNKYIMVNNNPKILYATVNRGHSRQSNSNLSLSADMVDGKSITASSYESLDMSLINDFAKSVQTELDERQLRFNGLLSNTTTTNSMSQYTECSKIIHSDSESLAASDLNSGCSSFYRRSKCIVESNAHSLLDTLSFDTIATGSYCESVNRGNDLNSEIRDTITSLENMPSEMGESSSLSHDFMPNDTTFRSCADVINQSHNSNKFVSFNNLESDSTNSSPCSSLYRTFAKDETSIRSKAKGMSPKLKLLKSKIRKSFRLDGDKSAHDKTIYEDCYEDDGIDVHSINSKSSHSSGSKSITDVKRQQMFESICRQIKNVPKDRINMVEIEHLIDVIRKQQCARNQVQSALDVCRSTDEFHNSRELIEAEQLMLMTCLKECSALEQLIALWQNGCEHSDAKAISLGTGTFTIKYLEFRLTNDSIFDAHFNYFYLCVCTYQDQVVFTMAKERASNSIIFNDIRLQFTNLMADFRIRVEVFALRLRKLARKDKGSEMATNSQCQVSRFRLQGKTQLSSVNLSRKMTSSSYHSPHKIERLSNGQYTYSSHGLISPTLVHCGQGNTIGDSLRIGYQEQLLFTASSANGFLNISDANQKWDRLWCRIDGFEMHFWKYPQDRNDDAIKPILTLNLMRSNHRDKALLVDREICPKPRTFKIDILNTVEGKNEMNKQCVETYFISAENQLDLELWIGEIQRIHQIIGCWNLRS